MKSCSCRTAIGKFGIILQHFALKDDALPFDGDVQFLAQTFFELTDGGLQERWA